MHCFKSCFTSTVSSKAHFSPAQGFSAGAGWRLAGEGGGAGVPNRSIPVDPALSSHKSDCASEVLMGFSPEALRWRSGLAQASLISENSVQSGRARLGYSLQAEELQETGSWDLAWTSPSGFEGSFCAGLLPNRPFPSDLPNPFRWRPSASPPPFFLFHTL